MIGVGQDDLPRGIFMSFYGLLLRQLCFFKAFPYTRIGWKVHLLKKRILAKVNSLKRGSEGKCNFSNLT